MSEEFAGPYTGWITVTAAPYSATGNGTTDDTAAIQAALDAMTDGSVLYFPAGTYRVTGGLYLDAVSGVQLVGADPATTTIQYDGAYLEYMAVLNLDGINYSKVSRLTVDGKAGTAWACVRMDQSGGVGFFPTGNELADLELRYAKYGIVAGSFGTGVAETTVKRCRLHHHTLNGFLARNFNTLDWWFWDCYVHHNNVGIGNHDGPTGYGGAGNCHAYRTIFEANALSDVHIGNCEYFSFRDCWSTGSKKFLYQYGIGDGNPISLQRCTILDPTDAVCIDIGSPGPLIAVDNTVRSLTGVTSYVFGAANAIVGGNTYSSAGQTAAGRYLAFDTESTVTRASLLALAAPSPAAFAAKQTRTVFEVTAGSSRATVQTAITNAAATGADGSMAVVHLQRGACAIDTALTVPANKRIQLVGDGPASQLTWTGPANGEPIVELTGPSHATLRDLRLAGASGGSGVRVQSADQTGARVYVDQLYAASSFTGLFAEWAHRCNVEGHAFMVTNATLGALFARGSTVAGFGGAHGSNEACYVLDRGGELRILDTWYEGVQPYLARLQGRGNFALWGTKIAAADPNHGSVPSEPPSLSLESHEGRAAVLAAVLVVNNRIGQTGTRSHSELLALGSQGSEASWWTGPGGAQSQAARVASNHAVAGGSEALADALDKTGASLAAWVKAQLAGVRALAPSALGTPTVGTTDVRLHKLDVLQCVHGVWVRGGTAPPALTLNPAPGDLRIRLRTLVVANAEKAAAQRVLARLDPLAGAATLVQGLNASGTGAATSWWASLALTLPEHEEVTVQLASQITATTVRDYDATTNAPSAILTALSLQRTAG